MRTPKEFARDVLREAVKQGVITDFAVREGGRATIYPSKGGGKFYTNSVLDTLALLKRLGFQVPE